MLRKSNSMTRPTMKGLEMPALLPGTAWKNMARQLCCLFPGCSQKSAAQEDWNALMGELLITQCDYVPNGCLEGLRLHR